MLISPLDVKLMRDMRAEGYSVKFIAKYTGFEELTVTKHTRDVPENLVPRFARSEVIRIKKLKADGHGIFSIVSQTGRSKNAVKFALKLEDIDSIEYADKELVVPECAVQKEESEPAAHISKSELRRNRRGYKIIPKGYVGLRTPTHPDGRW